MSRETALRFERDRTWSSPSSPAWTLNVERGTLTTQITSDIGIQN